MWFLQVVIQGVRCESGGRGWRQWVVLMMIPTFAGGGGGGSGSGSVGSGSGGSGGGGENG